MTEISICMVSLNCLDVIKDCLQSVTQSLLPVPYEIIIVDNGSRDGTLRYVESHYPTATLVSNARNVGFTRATNQAIQLSRGRYVIWLNTDTILTEDALWQLYRFMEERPKAGIAGPMVLNIDGTFQPQCRRGMPTPIASLCYLIGLDRLFPQHPIIGQYLLRYLPPSEPAQVDAVSGCCLMARREVWLDIGQLDEAIFAFGEDLDWCVRAKKAGWEIWYNPSSVIIHIKGRGGAHSRPFHKVWGTHQAMWVFYAKHLSQRYRWPVSLLVALGIAGSLSVSMAVAAVKQVLQNGYARHAGETNLELKA